MITSWWWFRDPANLFTIGSLFPTIYEQNLIHPSCSGDLESSEQLPLKRYFEVINPEFGTSGPWRRIVKQKVGKQKSNLSKWHAIIGWECSGWSMTSVRWVMWDATLLSAQFVSMLESSASVAAILLESVARLSYSIFVSNNFHRTDKMEHYGSAFSQFT